MNIATKKVITGISIDREVVEKLDKRRREISIKEGRDLARSTYINELLIKALKGGK
jgi:hypothetical protein